MKLEVRIEKEQRAELRAAPVRQAVLAALSEVGAPDLSALTVVVTGDEVVRELNARFMGIDAATDVLSFPSGESLAEDADEVYLGDIIISLARAAQQAAEGGHSLEEEVQLLTVHGCLHLLGFDHADAEEKDRMWAAQAAALTRLGNPLTPP